MATAAHRARDRMRRETAGAYLKAAGIGVRPPGAWERRPPAKPANENQVTTGSDAAKPTPTINPNPENLSTKGKAKATSKPANAVTAGLGVESTGLEVEEPKRIRSFDPPSLRSVKTTRRYPTPALEKGLDILGLLRGSLPGYRKARLQGGLASRCQRSSGCCFASRSADTLPGQKEMTDSVSRFNSSKSLRTIHRSSALSLTRFPSSK
jgi:hypothetical protein